MTVCNLRRFQSQNKLINEFVIAFCLALGIRVVEESTVGLHVGESTAPIPNRIDEAVIKKPWMSHSS